MKSKSLNQRRYAGIAVVLLALPISVFAGHFDGPYEGIYIFGDSVSDPGNVWLLSGQSVTAPYEPVPAAPYEIGDYHFSNGKTWAERFAVKAMVPRGGKAALAKPGRYGNYAFGGARARSGSGSPVPDSNMQVAQYLADFGHADPDSLYVLQFGGNDIRDALTAIAPGTPEAQLAAQQILQVAVTDLTVAMQTLYVAGAREFLVVNAPNLEHAPAVRLAGAESIAGLLASLYNGGLEGGLQALEAALPDVTVHRFDLSGLLDAIVSNGRAWGFTNVTDSCLAFFTDIDAVCENPRRYLFWDGIHPTTAAHAVLADRVATEVLSTRRERRHCD